jgi:hypothetical protein
MSPLTPASQEWQDRVHGLATLLCRNVEGAKSKVALAARSHYSISSVYRMFDRSSNPPQPWTEPVARCVYDLLVQNGLCPPELWRELSNPREHPLFGRSNGLGDGSPELIRPTPRNCSVFENGRLEQARRKADLVEVFGAIVPPELLSRSLARIVTKTVAPAASAARRRGIIHWANLRREALFRGVNVPHRYFVPESEVQNILHRDGVFKPLSWRQVRHWLGQLTRLADNDLNVLLALIDIERLRPEDREWLRGGMRITIGEQKIIGWPVGNGLIEEAGSDYFSSTAAVEEHHERLERLRSCCTHAPGNGGFLDRLSQLTSWADPNFRRGDVWDYDSDKRRPCGP